MDVDISVLVEEEEPLLAETMPSPETSTLVQAMQGSLSSVKTTPGQSQQRKLVAALLLVAIFRQAGYQFIFPVQNLKDIH